MEKRRLRLFSLLFFLLLVFLFIPMVQAVQINEMMYDPGQCSDTICEWIELYNPGALDLNLTGCFLDNKPLSGMLPGNDFMILARNIVNFATAFGSVNNIQAISLSLPNSGKAINLTGKTDCNDSIDYTPFTALANGNNKTLERTANNEWVQSKFVGGTPGSENSVANVRFSDFTLVISEVLPNPFEDDAWQKPDGEWIELYNYGDQELYAGGLKITDLSGERELYIADSNTEGDLFMEPGSYLVVYRNGDSDFSLNNDGYEEVRLLHDDELINYMSYSGAPEGMSWSNIDGEWYMTSPTPGEDNEYTGECIWGLFIDTNNSIFRGEDFSFSVLVTRFAGLKDAITVHGQIEDEHGNVIRTYTPWQNMTIASERKQTYSPNLPAGVYQASFWFDQPPCLDVDPLSYRVHQLIAISPDYQQFSPQITINELKVGSDDEVHWGEQFLASLDIFRGNTTKSTVEIWAEKDGAVISAKTKITVPEQFQHYPLTIPIQLLPNCNNKIIDGSAVVRAEGLNVATTAPFYIRGVDKDICKDYLDYVEEQSTPKSKIQYSLEQFPASLHAGEAARVTIKIQNDDRAHQYKAWSYVYRGSKCYSCDDSQQERDAQIEEIKLSADESRSVDLLVKLDDKMELGQYHLKVKIQKDAQKTLKELTDSFYVITPGNLTAVAATLHNITDNPMTSLTAPGNITRDEAHTRILSPTGYVVYETNTEKSQKLVPFLLALSLGLVGVALWRREKN